MNRLGKRMARITPFFQFCLFLRSLGDSFKAWSHMLHTRTGVNQSRSGTGRLLGEHCSHTPSPQFRLEERFINSIGNGFRVTSTNDGADSWYYWIRSYRWNTDDIHYRVANNSAAFLLWSRLQRREGMSWSTAQNDGVTAREMNSPMG